MPAIVCVPGSSGAGSCRGRGGRRTCGSGAAVADDEADGAAPAEAGLAGRVLGGDVEVLVEVAVDAPAPARLHDDLSCPLALPRASPPARSVCSAFRFRQAGAEGINMATARVMERIHCDGKLQEHP